MTTIGLIDLVGFEPVRNMGEAHKMIAEHKTAEFVHNSVVDSHYTSKTIINIQVTRQKYYFLTPV